MDKALLFAISLATAVGCATPSPAAAPAMPEPVAMSAPRHWVVGFSQIGAASDWRIANTRSIQRAFEGDPDFTLLYSDAQLHQEYELNALRDFIARKVDVILLTPIFAEGYRPVLEEARAAGIPVIMIDRDVQEADRELRLTVLRSDFVKEGETAGTCVARHLKDAGLDDGKTPVHIVELQGDMRLPIAIERARGFRTIVAQHPNWTIVDSMSAQWSGLQGNRVMETFLIADKSIQAVFAHNDQMALGAIHAIKAAGLRPGKDLVIASIDAVRGALQAIASGELSCSVECTPHLGPQVLQAVKDLRAGKQVPDHIWSSESFFDDANAAEALPGWDY
jgi:simple sugar transport system substrate-binding protein